MQTNPLQDETAPPFLSRENLKRFVKFGIVGASGLVVNVVVFELIYRWLLAPVTIPDVQRVVVANAAGIVVSIFTNFVLNDRWTWGDRKKGDASDWLRRLVKYYMLASVAAGVQLGVTVLTFAWVFDPIELVVLGVDLSPTASLLTGIGCGMFINFLASHFWAFRDAEPS